jgi:hypothetical protein
MFEIQSVAPAVFRARIALPLLTELVSTENGFCYRHGAPGGAFAGFIHRRACRSESFSAFSSCIRSRRRYKGANISLTQNQADAVRHWSWG